MSFNGPGSNGQEHRRLLRPGDRLAGGRAERRPVPAGRRLGAHRRRHQAVRRLQGPGDRQRDRRLRPLGQDQGRHAGDLRHELPDRLGRAEDPLDLDDADRAGRAAATTPPAPRSRAATSGSTASSSPARSSPAPSTTSTPSSAAWSPRSSKDGLAGSTTIIVTAKHGQSPQDPKQARHRPGRPDHQRDQRRLGAEPPDEHQTHRRRHRRRPVAVLPVGQLAGRVPTSSRATCGTTPPRATTSTRTRSPSSTPASRRSGPAPPRRTSSASPSTTAATRTSSARSRRASSTPSRPSSPSTAA